MAPGPTTTATITPPRSSHGIRDSWGYTEAHKDAFDLDVTHSNHDDARILLNGNSHTYHSGNEQARKVNSNDHQVSKLDHAVELRPSPLDDTPYSFQNGEDRKRNSLAVSETEDSSKWIHRDKLAKIESEELQAAGIFFPRARAPSKQRRDRDRSRSAIRRGTDASEHSHHGRSRKNSSHESRPENVVNSWDIRTPQEIAEAEANSYFTKPVAKGGSRIPVAKISAAPLVEPTDRTVNNHRMSESPEDEPLANHRTRSRSASMKGSDAASLNGGIPTAKRSATDMSPKKTARKTSGPKTGPPGRPKTRSGSTKESNGSISTRPSTRSGEISNNKAPEGDPPWMVNAYKPDPRLPPDQQLLPTVARRLQQEKWEKEGKFGDVYDKEFRPLNDNPLKPPELADPEKVEPVEQHPPEDEWPLRLEPAKSPTRIGSSYSTMPKIQDTPHAPLATPRTPVTAHSPHHETAFQTTAKPTIERLPEPVEDEKSGCGCCIVM
ncbi:hypothetical protein BGZ63DRAFT_399550 [Mariannaea sp. PMI_226]|nr:hypothetical protein BGZ63DRAFT_399550 [Mariannaea sp. PMI_226]